MDEITKYKAGDIFQDEDGESIKVMRNGGGYAVDRGRIKYGPGTFLENPHAFDGESGTLAVNKRWDMLRESFEEHVIEEFMRDGIDIRSAPDALGKTAAVIVKASHDTAPEKPKDAAIAFEKVSKGTGHARAEAQTAQQTALQINVTISPEIHDRYGLPDTIEGEFT
jgi:hypothetical protein